MKAVRIVEPGRVEFCEVPEPVVGAGEVLIRVKALGLCGSDLATYRGLNPMVSYPRIPGHEIAGEIVEAGSDVNDKFKTGQPVTVSPYTACGKCSACRVGRVNCCRRNETMGVQRDGAACEYIAVPYEKVFDVEGLTNEQAACVEPLSVGYHAVNRGALCERDTVLVFGCGVVGLGAIAGSAWRKATVIAVDIDDDKLAKAKKFSATYLINSAADDLQERVSAITAGDGASVVIEAVGLAETFRRAIELVSFAGRVVYIGYAKEPVEYETKIFVSKELDIRGSRNALAEEIGEIIDIVSKGGINVGQLVTHRYRVGEAGQALEFWDKNAGVVTKILLSF
jgi:2-desacetyl-2-hydroxyethyl bacteriochlorophyllide A dehydrogenase